VILLPAGPRSAPPTGRITLLQAFTDQDGRFVFDALMPGTYRVDVQKTGYASMFDPMTARQGPDTYRVGAGKSIENVVLHLQRGSVLAGKVLTASGDPLPDVRVMAMRRTTLGPQGTPPRLMPNGPGGQTNDLGEFRIAGLSPGDYYLAASPQPTGMFGGPSAPPPAGGASVATTTYYPGTVDQAAAAVIGVAPGATMDNLVFTMQSAPAFRISGIVVDQNDAPVSGAMVMVMSNPRNGPLFGMSGSGRTGEDGRFTVSGIPDGEYQVNVSLPMVAQAGPNAGGGGFVTFSSGTIGGGSGGVGGFTGGIVGGGSGTTATVSGKDVEGLRVVMQR